MSPLNELMYVKSMPLGMDFQLNQKHMYYPILKVIQPGHAVYEHSTGHTLSFAAWLHKSSELGLGSVFVAAFL